MPGVWNWETVCAETFTQPLNPVKISKPYMVLFYVVCMTKRTES